MRHGIHAFPINIPPSVVHSGVVRERKKMVVLLIEVTHDRGARQDHHRRVEIRIPTDHQSLSCTCTHMPGVCNRPFHNFHRLVTYFVCVNWKGIYLSVSGCQSSAYHIKYTIHAFIISAHLHEWMTCLPPSPTGMAATGHSGLHTS